MLVCQKDLHMYAFKVPRMRMKQCFILTEDKSMDRQSKSPSFSCSL